MRVRELIKELCKREGLKRQSDIAQVGELVGHLSDIVYEDGIDLLPSSLMHYLYRNGKRRAKKRLK